MSADRTASFLVAAAILVLAPALRADLCPDCKGKVFTQVVGPCSVCGGETNSLFKLCKACSARLGQCEVCRAPLAGAGPRAGERPAGETVGGVLVISDADRGKTARAQVGQEVVVRLHGEKAGGWTWKFDRSSSDAVAPKGKGKMIPGETRKGRFGGMNAFEFRFAAVKAGSAVLSFLGGRPWEWEKKAVQAWTVTVTVEVAPDPEAAAAARLRALRAGARQLVVKLEYRGAEDKPFYRLVLGGARRDADEAKKTRDAFLLEKALTPAQADRLVDHLSRSGFLARAAESPPAGAKGYVLEAGAGATMLYEDLGWGPKMLERLDALARALDGEPAAAMATLLGRLAGLREEWRKGGEEERGRPGR